MSKCRWWYNIRLELNYQIEGEKVNLNDPVIVLVNGLFADLTSFDGANFYLTKHFRVLRYDCRGQGKSPKPSSIYYLEDHVSDLFNLLSDLKITKVILVGLSNGGRIAMEFARLNPSMVSALVACDTYDVPTPMMKAKLNSWLTAFETGGGLHRFDIATPWIWGEEVFNEKSELLLSYRKNAEMIEGHVVRGLILGAMETAIDLTQITVPTLFVCGKEDLLTPPFNHEKMRLKVKASELVLVDGGHASLLEHPMTMEKTIIPWIEKQI